MRRTLLPISAIARKLNLPKNSYDSRGMYGAKLKLDLLTNPAFPRRGKLVLVTATTPTISGEGKTVVAIGLVQGLERIGKKALLTSREPSLGPVFGVKGGAAGGGLSQVEPSQKINLHFHGDIHAMTCAHNLLAALIDAHMFHGNPLDLDPDRITWPRTMDMNDRALRRIVVDVDGKREGANRHTGFVITAASEIMAIMALAKDRSDLRRRLASIVIGASRCGKPVRAVDLHATGAMMALLDEALLPNLVQTTEGTPALVHTGPFGNIAHGTSSVISQDMALRLADYVVNEAGFAADLGAEKYFDIVTRVLEASPSVTLLVTTVQSMRNQGDGDLQKRFANLAQHTRSLRRFGPPLVIAVNRFPQDSDADINQLLTYCTQQNVACSLAEPFTRGGEGSVDLAQKVVDTIQANAGAEAVPAYVLTDSYEEKADKVATQVYGADGVEFSKTATEKLRQLEDWGFDGLPICIAKTQYSLSDDPRLLGAPKGWKLRITDVSLSAGAGFVVMIAGNMMLMPGLPKIPRAVEIDVNESGEMMGV